MLQPYLTLFNARATQWLRAFVQLNWPYQLACVFSLIAITTSINAWAIHQHTQNLSKQLLTLKTQQHSTVKANTAPVPEPLSEIPQDTQYIQDLGRLFQFGKEVGISFGVIEYKSAINTKTPLTVRTMDLRINEDYPRMKGFISKVLNEMPHAALQEIRIERKDAQAVQGAMLVKLSLVYQAHR